MNLYEKSVGKTVWDEGRNDQWKNESEYKTITCHIKLLKLEIQKLYEDIIVTWWNLYEMRSYRKKGSNNSLLIKRGLFFHTDATNLVPSQAKIILLIYTKIGQSVRVSYHIFLEAESLQQYHLYER